MSAEAVTVMARLDTLAGELDQRSNQLAQVERELNGYKAMGAERVKGVGELYEEWLDAFVVGLWDKHVKDDAKMPSEEVRLRMARTQMPPQMLGQYADLMSQRKRLENRIRDIGKQVEAQRSILSALKQSAEADGSSLTRSA